MAVDNKYDPRLKGLKELEATLVVGEKTVQDILDNLVPSAKGELTDQSGILTGPRGSGKSHLQTLLYRKIKEDPNLSGHWLPLIFPEELFTADSLYRLLMLIIEQGMKKTGNPDGFHELNEQYNKIKSTRLTGSLKEKQAQKHTLAKELFQILRKLVLLTGKKWILMIENLQELLNNQLSEDDAKHLRSFMHKHPETFIIIGSALTVFDAIENYGKPFYHFFRLRHLDGLSKEEMVSFLRKIAETRKEKNTEEKIDKNRAYIYTFHLLTGGNPRLVLFLYELLMDYDELNTALILEKITELTPSFRDRTNDISSQRRLIVDALASEAPAQNVSEIAKYINEDLKSVSVQCSRMATDGWLLAIDIQAENVKKKETFYTLRDYFYRIWYKMRTGAIDESDLYCMAELSALLFDQPKLKARMKRSVKSNVHNYRIYEQALELKQDKNSIKSIQILNSTSKKELKIEGKQLRDSIIDLIDKERYYEAEQAIKHLLHYPDAQNTAYFFLGFLKNQTGQFQKATEYYDKAIKINPNNGKYWNSMGFAYYNLEQYEKAIECYDAAIKINPKDENTWQRMGNALNRLGKYEKAIESYDKTVIINHRNEKAWYNMGFDFFLMEEYAKAWSTFLNFFKYVKEYPAFSFGIVRDLKIIAADLFSKEQTIKKLKQKNISLDNQFEALVQLVLLGKLSDAAESIKIMLNGNHNYPKTGLKTFLFLLEADLIDCMNNNDRSEEALLIMQYLIRFKIKTTSKEQITNWFIRFIYNYLSVSDKESFNLNIIQNLMDTLNQQGILISDTMLTIINALQHPNSREAQTWMVAPLFAEIIKKMSD